MNIKLNPNDLKKLNLLFETLDTNIEKAESILSYINNFSRSITKKELASHTLPVEISYDLLMRKKLKVPSYVRRLSDIKLLNAKVYQNNPYYQHIHLDTVRSSNWTIENQPYLPYEAFVYNDVTVDETNYYEERFNVGFFETKFTYLNVSEKDVTWMSVTPNEIETMATSLEQVSGRVVTFGLGLGYFAYMASLKDNVTSVTIVETNPYIIELFTQHILPQFEHKDKITLVQKDAIEFAQNDLSKSNYDYAFVDIWHSVDDGFPLYIQIKKYEALTPQTHFHYWLESSMIAYLRRYVITLMREHIEGWTEDDYKDPQSAEEVILKKLFTLLKLNNFTTYQQIHDFLKVSSLQNISFQLSKLI